MAGYRPFGTTLNRFTNITELPEPIDYRTQQVKAGTEYAKKIGGFQASYLGSTFKNRVSTLVWDNAFQTTDLLGSSSRGRLDLYPDNTAHSLSFAGAVNIPHSTRLMASVTPGWMRQNDPFLPYTINTAIPDVTPPGTTILPVPSLPATSLHGSKQTLAMNYTMTTKAAPRLPVTLRYRSYDYHNHTPDLIFPDWVITDAYSYGVARMCRSLTTGRRWEWTPHGIS
jgi:Putative outer membrane beta-barrel porin, MtrB/PioB